MSYKIGEMTSILDELHRGVWPVNAVLRWNTRMDLTVESGLIPNEYANEIANIRNDGAFGFDFEKKMSKDDISDALDFICANFKGGVEECDECKQHNPTDIHMSYKYAVIDSHINGVGDEFTVECASEQAAIEEAERQWRYLCQERFAHERRHIEAVRSVATDDGDFDWGNYDVIKCFSADS